jgi:hypothetical protein
MSRETTLTTLDIIIPKPMSDWKKITMADLETLPVGHRQRIPEDYLDANNHMNVILF